MSGSFDFNAASASVRKEIGLEERPYLQIRPGEIAAAASEIETILLDAPAPFYDRDGLVRPYVRTVPAAGGLLTSVPAIMDVDVPTLTDWVSRYADLAKYNARTDGFISTDLPDAVGKVILSRKGEWNFPPLAGVITTPTIRRDGAILSQAGYDPDTRLLLMDPLRLPAMVAEPTKEDAHFALNLLINLLGDFPFVDDASRSVALSGFLSTVARGALTTVPCHAANAHVAGTGKSYLVSLFGALAIGDNVPVIAIGRTEEETEKRLGSALLASFPIVCLDNVNGELGGDALCQVIERPLVSIRVLGKSKIVTIENRATVFATGNNIQIRGDMVRRTIMCNLDANVERPELRQFGQNPFAEILANRGRYVAAALTVVRAYAVAGFPGELPVLGSFEDWSRMVRSALVWLGQADPIDTIQAARDSDPETQSLAALLPAWRAVAGDVALPAREIADRARLRVHEVFTHGDLREALLELAANGRGDDIDPRRLGKRLKRFEGRIVNNLRIITSFDTHKKIQLWRVELIE